MLETASLRWFDRLVANLTHGRAYIFSFALGFTIRLIPELLSYPNPIGFDTLYYAVRVKSGVVWSDWTSVFSLSLFEGIIIAVNRILQADPLLLLKLVAPLLYGLNVSGIYHFSRKALNWTAKTSLVATCFFAFQLASLRLSWDLHRNLLGLAILLFTLPLMRKIHSKKDFAIVATLSLLLAFSHILVASILLAIALAAFIGERLKSGKLQALKPLLAVSPALAVLLLGNFVFLPAPITPDNIMVADDIVRQSPGGLFFLVNYMGMADPAQNYPTYPVLVLHVVSLFSILYLWWLPLVLVGFFRDKSLDGWALLLVFASFNALITPFCALDLWNRWMFMLVYPFTFYAINGVRKAFTSGNQSVVSDFRCPNWIRVTRKKALAILSIAVILGSIFLTVPPFFDRFGLLFVPPASPYLPSTMLYNSVPLRDVGSTIKALRWLNERMNRSSVLVVHHAFLWWAKFYLDSERVIISFVRDIDKALYTASEQGYQVIYTIWWNEQYVTWQNENIGWYGFTLPLYFSARFNVDRISTYEYTPS